MLKFKKLHKDAQIPRRNYNTDAGFDLFALENCILFPGERKVIKTGIAFAPPPGYYGRIAPRSGLAVKSGIDVMAGVADFSYRGDLSVVLFNAGEHTFGVNPGDKIAQLVVTPYYTGESMEVEDLDETERGDRGFGSSDHDRKP